MITPKGKMRIHLAVKDYINMFPDDYKGVLETIAYQKDHLEDEMAEIKSTHAIKRLLGTMPERLFQMIQLKLDDKDLAEFKAKDGTRWFFSEYPQFRITEHI